MGPCKLLSVSVEWDAELCTTLFPQIRGQPCPPKIPKSAIRNSLKLQTCTLHVYAPICSDARVLTKPALAL